MGRHAVMTKSINQGQSVPAVAVAPIDTTHPTQVGAKHAKGATAVSGKLIRAIVQQSGCPFFELRQHLTFPIHPCILSKKVDSGMGLRLPMTNDQRTLYSVLWSTVI